MSPLRHFHPVLESRLLPRSSVRRIELAGRPYALFRDANGRPGALADACPHRFAPLSLGRVRRDGTLACAYHGWHFDRDGRGVNPSQPGLRGCDTESLQVVDHQDCLWVAHRDTPLSALPGLAEAPFQPAGSYSRMFEVPLHVPFSNFIDVEHVLYIHATGLGTIQSHFGVPSDFKTRVADDEVVTSYRYSADSSAPSWLVGTNVLVERVSRFDPLRITDTITWENERRKSRSPLVVRITSFFVPETLHRTRVMWFASIHGRNPLVERMLPLIQRAVTPLLSLTTRQDQRFLNACGPIPFETTGMRLDRLDGPVVANLKALARSDYKPVLLTGPSLVVGGDGAREASDVSLACGGACGAAE